MNSAAELFESEQKDEVQGKERVRIEPGWYRDLPNDVYHGSSGWSSTTIKKLLKKTPAHLKAGFTQDHEATANMNLGTAVHTLVLEPAKFDEEIAVSPVFNRRTNAGKAAAEKFEQDNAGKTIINEEQHKQAQTMANNVRQHPMFEQLMDDAICESSVFQWYDSMDPDDNTDFRELIKVRPDAASTSHSILLDLKSTKDASYTGFQQEILKYSYHFSAAMYLEVCNKCPELLVATKHLAFTGFVWIAVENFEPYEVAFYEMDAKFREIGAIQFRRAMIDLHKAKQDGWPGYSTDLRVMEPPTWANKNFIV